MTTEQMNGIIRHILSGVGAYLVAIGKLDPEQTELWIGAIMAIVAVVWSYRAKRPVPVE